MAIGNQANRLFSGLILEDRAKGVLLPTWRLAILYLVTIFQFVESLPDQLAADAVRDRVDWKYALHLPMNTPGLPATSLCEFRQGLLAGPGKEQNLQTLLERLKQMQELNGKARFSLKTERVLTYVCRNSRLANTWEAIRQALEALAASQPELLHAASLPHWYERYGHRREILKLGAARPEQEALAQAIGGDGAYLLKAISEAETPGVANLPEVLALQQVWREQYEQIEGKVSWRTESCARCCKISETGFPAQQGNPT